MPGALSPNSQRKNYREKHAQIITKKHTSNLGDNNAETKIIIIK